MVKVDLEVLAMKILVDLEVMEVLAEILVALVVREDMV